MRKEEARICVARVWRKDEARMCWKKGWGDATIWSKEGLGYVEQGF